MGIGDILNPNRVRTQANERLDTVDTEALSQAPRSFLDAFARAISATPRNVGSSSPTGLIFQGFGFTLNPTGPSDNKIRVQSPPGVAFDANGRMLIKENGVTVDLTLASGNSQIYAFYIDDNANTTIRRFISVTSPYVESGSAIPTTLKGDVAYWVRAGDQTSIVSSDVVNGQTTALCFLGIVNNSGGACTMTGYDSVTAPNGAYATNRITSVIAPTTPPPANTANGSPGTMLDVITAALYYVGQLAWSGSVALVPTAANNFGAYQSPALGVQGLAELITAFITVAHTWSALQTFNGANDTSFSFGVSTPPDATTFTPKPLWFAVLDAVAGIKIRFYAIYQGGYMVTINANVTGFTAGEITYARDAAAWTDTSPAKSMRLAMLLGSGGSQPTWEFQYIDTSGGTSTWTDGDWATPVKIVPDAIFVTNQRIITIPTLLSTSMNITDTHEYYERSPGVWTINPGNDGSHSIYYPVQVPYNATLIGYRINVKKLDSGNIMIAQMVWSDDTGDTAVGSGVTMPDTGTPYHEAFSEFFTLAVRQMIFDVLSPHAVTQNQGQYYVKITPSATSGGGTTDKIIGVDMIVQSNILS